MKKAFILSVAIALCLSTVSLAETLRGSWDTEIGIAPAPLAMTVDMKLAVTYSLAGWTFTSNTVVEDASWTDQTFTVQGFLGGFSFNSTVDFDPALTDFTSWATTASVSYSGVLFSGTFALTTGGTTFDLIATGAVGLVDGTIDIALGDGLGCNLNFGGIDMTVNFPYCCAKVTGTVSFDCIGFAAATFRVVGIALPGVSWATLEILLTFTVDEKKLDITPHFDFGVAGCMTIYFLAPGDSDVLFGGITIDGIGLFCTIGGVDFTGVSYFGNLTEDPQGLKPGILAGTPYWEAYRISTTEDGCCGLFSFDVTVYFLEGGATLFDLAEVDANVSIEISTQFALTSRIDVVLDPVTELSLGFGFEVEW